MATLSPKISQKEKNKISKTFFRFLKMDKKNVQNRKPKNSFEKK
jgi:hypothetical protein